MSLIACFSSHFCARPSGNLPEGRTIPALGMGCELVPVTLQSGKIEALSFASFRRPPPPLPKPTPRGAGPGPRPSSGLRVCGGRPTKTLLFRQTDGLRGPRKLERPPVGPGVGHGGWGA